MGNKVSVQTITKNINTSVSQTIIQNSQAASNAKCNIEINSVNLTNSVNCSVTIKNECSAQATVSQKALTDTVVNVYNNLNTEQKDGVVAYFQNSLSIQTDVTNVTNDFRNYIEQNCTADSNIVLNIKAGNINIDNCKSTEGQVDFTIINTGEAISTCVMDVVTRMAVDAVTQAETKQSAGIDLNSLIWPILIGVIVLVAAYIVYLLVTKTILSFNERVTLEKVKQENYATRISNFKKFMTE